MNIEAKCKNCRFCKEMTGPYDTDNYYVCMRGSLVLTIKPEEKCAHIVEVHTTRYCTLIKQYIKGQSIPVECTLKEQ